MVPPPVVPDRWAAPAWRLPSAFRHAPLWIVLSLELFSLSIALLLAGLNVSFDVMSVPLVRWLASWASVISNFRTIAHSRPDVSLYLCISVLLSPMYVAAIFFWLRSAGLYFAQFVPSPRYWYSGTIDALVLNKSPRLDEGAISARDKLVDGRGLAASLFVLLVLTWSTYVEFQAGWDYRSRDVLNSVQTMYGQMAQGGLPMWLGWEVRHIFGCFSLAVVACVVREYWVLANECWVVLNRSESAKKNNSGTD